MLMVNLWIIQYWLWRLCPRCEMAQRLVILLEQGVNQGDQPSDNVTENLSFPLVGLGSFIVTTEPRNQALVQRCPLGLGLDCLPCHQVHGFLHLTRTSSREIRPVKGDACLCSLRCPAKIRLEVSCTRKISNMTKRRKDGGCKEWTHRGNREENLSLPTVFYDLADFRI